VAVISKILLSFYPSFLYKGWVFCLNITRFSAMSFKDNLEKILAKYKDFSTKLSQELPIEEYIKLSKEYAELEPIVEKINRYNNVITELESAKELAYEPGIGKETAEEMLGEVARLESLLPSAERDVKISLLPRDEADGKGAIIEVRAGTGGEEAALFAAKLFNMYQRYVESKGWKFEILAISDTGIGGYKEASALVSGKNAFLSLKFESGVHRVQRVPDTESSGRIHTSAATVAVLPEAEEVDVTIDEKDLKIDTYRASGAGGQHVNTTDSAVRITHIPTGIVVALQDEKSQHKNKAKAMKILRSRIYEAEREKKDAERALSRKNQVGSGDRSERIRTYNFPQSRVTDHRINMTLYKIEDVVNDGRLDEIITMLIADDEAKKLTNTAF
jgi:peptide chain release factor 1